MSERPTGVRPEVIEQGRRIIEEDREFLDMLAEYDEGERTNTVDVQRESMNSQNTAQSDDVGLYATKQGGHEESVFANHRRAQGRITRVKLNRPWRCQGRSIWGHDGERSSGDDHD